MAVVLSSYLTQTKTRHALGTERTNRVTRFAEVRSSCHTQTKMRHALGTERTNRVTRLVGHGPALFRYQFGRTVPLTRMVVLMSSPHT